MTGHHDSSTTDEVSSEGSACWCCGGDYDERQLSRLGEHPEVGVCVGCAQWLYRRARAQAESGRRTPGAFARRGVALVRTYVVGADLHERRLIGPLLHRLDRHLP